jgi:hypothetical protein
MYTTTKQGWIAKVVDSKAELRQLVERFHPARLTKEHTAEYTITAPGAETASTVVRELIRAEMKGRDVLAEFDKAVDTGDVHAIYTLLNAAWFGVPESSPACWEIPGFAVAVDLLDDVPEPEGE